MDRKSGGTVTEMKQFLRQTETGSHEASFGRTVLGIETERTLRRGERSFKALAGVTSFPRRAKGGSQFAFGPGFMVKTGEIFRVPGHNDRQEFHRAGEYGALFASRQHSAEAQESDPEVAQRAGVGGVRLIDAFGEGHHPPVSVDRPGGIAEIIKSGIAEDIADMGVGQEKFSPGVFAIGEPGDLPFEFGDTRAVVGEGLVEGSELALDGAHAGESSGQIAVNFPPVRVGGDHPLQERLGLADVFGCAGQVRGELTKPSAVQMEDDGEFDEEHVAGLASDEGIGVAEAQLDGGEGGGAGSGLALDIAETGNDGKAFELSVVVVGIVLDDVVEERLGPLEADQGRGGIAEVAIDATPLHFAHAEIGVGELAFEFPIVGGALGQIIEIFDAIFGEELAGAEGAGKFADGALHVKDDGGGQLADLVETLLGEAGLADGNDGSGDHRSDGEGSEGDGNPIAADELSGAVVEGIGAGEDGTVVEMAADVLGEGFDGFVAAVGIFLHGTQNDDVEVTGEAFGDGGIGTRGGSAGREGFFGADGALEGEGGNLIDLVGFGTGEEFVKNSAEGVDIGGNADGFAEDLFRASVVRSEHADALSFGGFAGFGEEELGDAEVEEFGSAGMVDEDVAGLDVAMNDKISMGVLDGAEDGEEEAETVFGAEFEGFGVVCDPGSVDILHDEIGNVFGGGAAVEEASDIGMLEAGEDLAFATETLENELGIEAGLDEFDGDLGFVLFVGSGGEIDSAHATTTEFADEGVGSDAAPFDGGIFARAEADNGILDLSDDDFTGALAIAIEERFDFGE